MNKNKINLKTCLSIIAGIIILVATLSIYTTFSLNNESYKFESKVYKIENNYIDNISPNTSVELFKKYFDLENCLIEITLNKDKLKETDLLPNGSKTILYDSNNNVVKTYINIIKGDFNSDGLVNETDLTLIGKCLVDNCKLEEHQIKSIDINNDNELHINDLSLLDKALTNGYIDISLNKTELLLHTNEQDRLVAKLTPNYGLEQNVKWVSLSEEIATVDKSGIVTGHNEGETIIQAITKDDKLIKEAKVVVDNTIRLETYEGIAYIGGENLKVKIKLVDYEGVTCQVNNPSLAECSIDGKNLSLKALDTGNTTIEIKSPKYGETTFNLTTYSVYLNVMPKYFCTTPGNIEFITVSGFYTGELSFTSSNKEIIKDAYMTDIIGRRMLKIEIGSTEGRETLKVKESNGNTTNDVVIDVTRISIPEIGGYAKVGTDSYVTVQGNNIGELSCVVDNEAIATCRTEGNQLIITPLQTGVVNIDVYNKFYYFNEWHECGKTEYIAVIEE